MIGVERLGLTVVVVWRLEPGADLIGFGDAKFGVEGEGFLPVARGLIEVAGGMMGVAEAVVGASLLVPVADLAGQAERCGMPGAGIVRLAGEQEHFAESVQCLGLTGLVADLAA